MEIRSKIEFLLSTQFCGILKLSDSYLVNTPEPMLELSTKIININLPVDHNILKQCRPLYEYSWFIERMKEYIRRGTNRDKAIKCTVKDCEKNGIMAEFMREHGSEVSNMSAVNSVLITRNYVGKIGEKHVYLH